MPSVAVPEPPVQAPIANQVAEVFAAQRARALELRAAAYPERKARLAQLARLVSTHEAEILQAVYDDFRKPPAETAVTEVMPVRLTLRHAQARLRAWMRPRRVPTPLTYVGTRGWVRPEPKGVTLIISPWNYPFMLLFEPLVSALAAGNTAMLKPSELTPHLSALVARLIPQYFPAAEVAVFEGGPEVAQALLAQPFDHIFFTGSPAVGKIVMQAAAQHLSSVTLELGGKSPVVVDRSAPLAHTARKIVWGKFVNNGQSCVAPDYVLVPPDLLQPLVDELQKALNEYYNPDGQGFAASPSLARVINARHYQRLLHLLQQAQQQGARVVCGGQTQPEELYLAPTLLTHVRPDMAVLQEEIFGPILPLLTYQSREEALAIINDRPKPLSLYVFSRDQAATDYWVQHTSAGGTTVNDTLIHFAHEHLPFGGAGHSGLGRAHGQAGFEAFSNLRPVLRQRVGYTNFQALYPPYGPHTFRLLGWMKKWFA